MSFSGQHDHISRLSVGNGITDGLLAVTDLHVFSGGFSNPHLDIINDGLGLLKPGIIGCDDGQIRQPPGHLAHLVSAVFGTVPPASEETHQTGWMVFLQGGQKAFQAHGIMGVIDHQGKVIRHLHHLDPSLDLRRLQCLLDHLRLYPEMSAHCNGCQGIVDAECPRNVDLHIKIHGSADMIRDSQIARSGYQVGILRPKVRFFRKPEGLHPAVRATEHVLIPGIVYIGDSQPALLEKQSLAPFVILKILMLVGADVVMAQVGKDPDLKGDPRGPVQHQPLGGNLHDHAVAARLHHFRKILVDGVGFRRGVGCRDLLFPDDRLDGPDQPHLVSHILQDGLDHIGGGGLSLGSGDADDL